MRNLIIITLFGLLFIVITEKVEAQDDFETVSFVYSLQYNQSSYNSMQSRFAERGITPAEFGSWLANNGALDMRSEGTTQSPQTNLTIFTVNSRGVIGGESITGSNTPEHTTLNRVVNDRQVAQVMENLIPSNIFIPDDAFIPATDSWQPLDSETFLPPMDNWHPLDNGNSSFQRMASDASQRALRQANAGNDGIAIVLIVSPDRIGDKTKVTPGGAVFVGTTSKD